MALIQRYLVWQCTSCGKWQGREIRKIVNRKLVDQVRFLRNLQLKCQICNKSIAYIDKIKGGVKVKEYKTNDAKEAMELIKKLSGIKKSVTHD